MRHAEGSPHAMRAPEPKTPSHEGKIRLLSRMENLPDGALLDKLMLLVEMPLGMRPAAVNAPLQRALAVVEWADSSLGCGLDRLHQALEQLAVPPLTDAASTPHNGRPLAFAPCLATLHEAELRLKELVKSNAPRAEIDRQRAEIAALRRAEYEGPALAPGHLLAGRYELLEVLGAGGFGCVWRAYDERRSANVAIKVLHPRFRADESMKRRFRLGARIMQELAWEHKRIVQVLEPPQQSDGCDFFVMEYLARGNLETAVARQTFTNEELYPAISQAGQALHFAHTRGVVHRDVNPSNILIHEDGSFRLSDFDIARVPLASIGSAAQIGRPEYLAPEVLFGGSKGDARSDLYGLAKTAQFLIWGQELPLEGKKDAAAFSVALSCPVEVQRVLQTALADRPEERHASVAEFLAEFEAALSADEARRGTALGGAALQFLETPANEHDTAVVAHREKNEDESPPPKPSVTAHAAMPATAGSPPPELREPPTPAGVGINRRLVQWPDGPPVPDADYHVVGVLGRGGMGEVYRALQLSLNREVALKVLRLESRRSGRQMAAAQQRFLAEAVIAAALDHPHVTPIYDLGVDQNGWPFYAMKIVRGQSWGQIVRSTSELENLDILLRVCDAVAYAHAQGVVHRDLKPGNVMVGDFGELYVMDWGLAAASEEFQDSTQVSLTASIGGTLAYMAPEMISGDASRIGPYTDVYLLGAVLYEILTGLLPHPGNSAMETLQAITANRISYSERNDELVGIALRAMATDPQDRYADARDFQRALRACVYHHVPANAAVAAPARTEPQPGGDAEWRPEAQPPKTLGILEKPVATLDPPSEEHRWRRRAGVLAWALVLLGLAWAFWRFG